MAQFVLYLSVILFSLCVCTETNNASLSARSTTNWSRFTEFNSYYLYTRDNPREELRLYATSASASAVRTFRSKTVIIVHDQAGSSITSLNPTIKDALLTAEDVSVIVVDWSIVASLSDELILVAAPQIAAGITELIRVLLNARRITMDNLHMVGFGHGAHIVGYAAREATGTVARITALDPAGGVWASNAGRLSTSDAHYVEVIHTDSSGVGLSDTIGHVDFFPNGGITQQGCTASSCNHDRAWQFFAATITHSGLAGNRCNDGSSPSDSNCRGYTMAMGNNELVKYGSGSFFIETSDKYPYDNQLNCVLACMS